VADQPNPSEPEIKDEMVRIRASKSLMARVRKKLRARGGWSLAAVTRALWEVWLEEDVINADDVARQVDTAPKRRKKDSEAKK
jgi:hypothetical protein